ncbi:MAG: heavy metal translocating P-type ATPase [Sediminibacterium sp.]|jgi:Cu+-exporting ATPase
MEKVNLEITGMSCTNCALTVERFLKDKGLTDIKVNFLGGDASFTATPGTSLNDIKKGLSHLGYPVKDFNASTKQKFLSSHLHRFIFCTVFTLPLMLHMIPGVHIHGLMNPWIQLGFTLPVFIVGMGYFGRSAWNSVVKGIPNMNVLIVLGAIAALGYSLYGTLIGKAEQFMFYETTAAIITLVFLGNWLEDKSVETTQRSLQRLIRSQKTMANMIAYDEQHQEHIFPVESSTLKIGDLVLIRTGEAVPMDCKILSGEAAVNESVITGESIPVQKQINDLLIGGSIITNGSVKAYITAVGADSVLGNILQLVKNAQTEKPPVQLLADKISAVFVPVVIGIAVFSLGINYFFAGQTFTDSLLRSIAILVIACPCAMGLATPAAIAVGLGRAARNGILFKQTRTLELFKNIKTIVFDKTGTLTTGNFVITNFGLTEVGASLGENTFKQLVYSLEKYSAHPLAKAITVNWKHKEPIRFIKATEQKGLGVEAIDKEGNIYKIVSHKALELSKEDTTHSMYLIKNDIVLGWLDLEDEIRPAAAQVIQFFRQQKVKTILLSGDRKAKCEQVANVLGMDEVYAEVSPQEKMEKIAMWNEEAPVAMVGDGINDAPALAKATIGISLSEASQIAMQSADIVLMNNGFKNLPSALGIGKHTYKTIRENLFWALIYNVVAIPVAAFGLLTPTVGALVMGLSDVVLAINSVRLNFKKVVPTA